MNAVAYFEIQATELEKARDFYQKVFAWQFSRETGMPVEYWHIVTDGIRGGLLKRPAPARPLGSGTNAFVCSIEVASFDATASKIMQNGGQVALPKFAVPGVCWQGYFLDIDGNTFGIFQVDANAK